ncbi:sensor histidine kinase [Ramlibacter sp. MMS24-I3-19]|uniref:sensor histidine kinase n=1 Tax=Ramlibacter sp. MMS24-I3-19 TaxID=3416606 RepID=UPI003CFC16E4
MGAEWAFAIVHPVVDAQGRLLGAIELRHAAASLAIRLGGPLPEGSAVTLLDQRLAILARSPGHEQFVGRVAHDIQRAQALRGDRSFTGLGPDGVRRLYAPRRIAGTGWTVAVGVPVDVLLAPGRDALLRSLAVALAVLALCVWLVLRLARSITQPLLALERTAAAAAAGDFSGRAPQGGPAELSAVAAGVNLMMERMPELQRKLLESAERTAQLVDRLSRHLPSMIFVYRRSDDGTASFPYTSHAITQVFELDPAEVRMDAQAAFDRVHPADQLRLQEILDRSARDKAPFQHEFRVVLPRRGVRHILALAQAERRKGQNVWYGSMTDVTELHTSKQAVLLMNETLEHRIAERTAALEAANTALEAFAYSVAHDLRAPLHSIEGFGQGVLHALDLRDPDRARSFVARVLANTQRMNLLIDGFLALARAGRSEMEEAPVDLQRLVEEVLAELPRSGAARVEVGPLPRVIAEAASLRQVWENLLSNAFKYSSGTAEPLVRVEWTPCGQEAQFTVTDNGAGFDPDYADKLFQPFSRLHKPHEFEGNGVGLAVVRRIVERHGGRVWAESRPGEGARFGFALPAERVLARVETLPA